MCNNFLMCLWSVIFGGAGSSGCEMPQGKDRACSEWFHAAPLISTQETSKSVHQNVYVCRNIRNHLVQ